MIKEIKEIKHRLQLLHAECNPKAREEDINYTLDYITNLQMEIDQSGDVMAELTEENERLKKELNNKEFVFVGTAQNKTRDFIKNLIKENERLQARLNGCDELLENDMKTIDDYKSRCKKASEYIKKNNFHYMNEYALERFRNDLLNILQNGSDSQ